MPITPQQLAAISQLLQQPGREQMPWERRTTTPVFDMFGSQDDDPRDRLARELQFDRANAAAELESRIGDIQRFRGPAEAMGQKPLTAEEIADEVNLKYGLQRPGESNRMNIVKSGSTVLRVDPYGNATTIYEQPDKTDFVLDKEKLEHIGRLRLQLKNNPPRQSERAMWQTDLDKLDEEEEKIRAKYKPQGGDQRTGQFGTRDYFRDGFNTVAGDAAAPTEKPTTKLREGQRVRNKNTGQMGTVVNGQIVPD